MSQRHLSEVNYMTEYEHVKSDARVAIGTVLTPPEIDRVLQEVDSVKVYQI